MYDNEEDYNNTHYIPSLNISNHDDESLNKQILETYKQQRKLGRNILAKHGIYYTFGLVYFMAQKWLSKVRDIKITNIKKLSLPVKLSDDRAENSLFTVRTTDHVTHRSISIIGSLITYMSKMYLQFQHKAKTINYKDIATDEIIFFGKFVIHSNVFSGYTYDKIPNYKNYLITRNKMTHHILISRPQKILRAGNIEELGRTILYPLYPESTFSDNVLEEIHQMYCSKDVTYAMGRLLKENLFHKHMKAKLSIFNKTCPMSCIYRSLTMEERYRMYNPHGLGGSLQFKATQDIASRMNSVICDLMGPYFTRCRGTKCTQKIYFLLLLNPATQFLAIEILQDYSTAEVIAGLIRHMSKFGAKNIFLSDNGSHFMPL